MARFRKRAVRGRERGGLLGYLLVNRESSSRAFESRHDLLRIDRRVEHGVRLEREKRLKLRLRLRRPVEGSETGFAIQHEDRSKCLAFLFETFFLALHLELAERR